MADRLAERAARDASLAISWKQILGTYFAERRSVSSLELSVPPLLGLATVRSGCLFGLDLRQVIVEVASRRGPAFFQMAGLAETAVREARIRVSSAVARLGITLEEFSLTVSLAPADLPKSGSGLDLAIALGILVAIGHIGQEIPESTLVLGELALDGQVRPVPGVLPLLDGARKSGYHSAFVPQGSSAEAAHVGGLDVRAVRSLSELIDHLDGKLEVPRVTRHRLPAPPQTEPDLQEIVGQAAAKRALTVAAAGSHNLLLIGPPGSGKSMLARRLPSLLPELSIEQALLTTSIHSVSGLVDPKVGIVRAAPFRAPHHTVSDAGLVGGGPRPRPGEISLAHNGVLFLDELPEFRRTALEALRQPLEEGVVHVVRAKARVSFPARPMLVAAMNPCPCGHYGNPRAACICSPVTRSRYLGRISGPLLERIDLQIHVPPVDVESLGRRSAERKASSADVREQVTRARQIQTERFRDGRVRRELNSLLDLSDLERVASLPAAAQKLLDHSVDRLGLSARSYVRVLRVARTLADLEQAARVDEQHLAEALRYRSTDWSRLIGASQPERSSARDGKDIPPHKPESP